MDYQRVLDAERSLLEQQNSLAADELARPRPTSIALYKALGGGWELRQGQPVVARRDAARDEEAHQLGRSAVAAARARNDRRSLHAGEALESLPWPRRSRSVRSSGSRAVARRRGRRVHRRSITGKTTASALPEGIASGNGRIEAKLVDVAAKEPLRVKEILVDEGALVKPGRCWCASTP